MKRIAKDIKREMGRFYKKNFKIRIDGLFSYLNMKGNKHGCNICNQTFSKFLKYHGGNNFIPDFRLKLDLVDSDRDNFHCPYCRSFDRERHLFMYFDKMGFWDRLAGFQTLHFAPEKYLAEKIQSLSPETYFKADYNPREDDVKRIDATDIPYDNDTFDLVICNHVLEHISNYFEAMTEIYRVLKPNGMAILQTPYSRLLSENFEDIGINTDGLRDFFYGETDHYRIFGEKRFFSQLEKVGFRLEIISHKDYFNEGDSFYYGVNSKEDLVLVRKAV